MHLDRGPEASSQGEQGAQGAIQQTTKARHVPYGHDCISTWVHGSPEQPPKMVPLDDTATLIGLRLTSNQVTRQQTRRLGSKRALAQLRRTLRRRDTQQSHALRPGPMAFPALHSG